MSQMMSADGGRTETKRFTDDVDATELIKGDRIDPMLVARMPGELGQPIQPVRPGQDDQPPKTQLVAASVLDTMDDVHSAILVDDESGLLVRASRHDSNSAMNQKEADWKVREIGTKVAVETVHELTLSSSDDPVDDDAEYIEGWADIVLGDMAKGHFDYVDEVKMNNRTLVLSDTDGRKGMATITLEQ